MKKQLFHTLIFLTTATAVFSILGYLGKFNWFFDLFSHFKAQYLFILVVGTGLIFVKSKRYALLFLPFIFLLLLDIVPLYFGGQKNSDLTKTTKMVCINLLSSNNQYEDVASYISQKEPDMIVLQECTMQWQSQLEPKLKDYPFRLSITREDNFGIAVYSKIKMSNLKEHNIGNDGIPSISGDFNLGDKQVTLVATHPFPPIGSNNSESRNFQLSELSRLVVGLENKVIVIGDLNTSSFSTHFKQFIKDAKLVDSRKGFGLLTTWPTWFALMQTTLDHCLVSQGIQIKSREVGKNIGSDHLPIFVEFGVE